MQLFFSILIGFLAITANAQIPTIQWQKPIGGSGSEYDGLRENITRIVMTVDKGYIMMGVSVSSDGDVGQNAGWYDIWVVKYSNVGSIQWKRTFGGNSLDFAHDIRQTSDGGYIICGTTGSTNGVFSQRFGDVWDIWLIKISSAGDLQWQNFYGGTNYDWGMNVVETNDGYVACGRVTSSNGQVSGNHGSADIWLFKTNRNGVLQWQHCYGGNNLDVPFSIEKVPEGGFIIGGYQLQPGPYSIITAANFEAYVIKTDASGNIIWEKKYGGSYYEDIKKIRPTSDGGYIFVGSTKSNDGDVSGTHPSYLSETGGYTFDIWVVKLSNAGDIEWQKPLGGSFEEWGFDVAEVSDGYFVVGTAESSDGDISGQHGYQDAWMVKLNLLGNIISQKCFGGGQPDAFHSISAINNNELIAAGYVSSGDGDVVGNYEGSSNLWLVKLSNQPFQFNTLLGSIYIDSNANGFRDGMELDYDNKKVFIGESNGFVSSYDNLYPGFFSVKVDTGRYETSISSNDQYRATPIRKVSQFNTYSNAIYFEFGMIPVSLVSGMFLFIDTFSVARPNQNISYFPTYSYNGSRNTLDALIKIVKDPRLSYVSSTVPLLAVNNDTLSFRVNNLEVGIHGNFDIVFSIPSSPVILPGDSLKFYSNILPMVIDSAYFNKWDTFVQVVQPPINTIYGNAYLDHNGNNNWDQNEPVFEEGIVTSEKNLVSVFSQLRAGEFKNEVDTGTYTSILSFYNPYYTVSPVSRNSVFNTYYNTDSFDFAVKPVAGIRDIETTVMPVFNAKPGFENMYVVYYSNKGTDTVASGSIHLILDQRVTFLHADSTPSEIHGDTLVWNINNLYPLNTVVMIIEVRIKAPPLVNIGDTIKVTSIISPLTNDQQPADNIFEISQVVVGSFDPNDKMESHSGMVEYSKINNGEYLNYIIRFQNTGNDTAFKILVIDTLEDKLDPKSFDMISSSHPYTMNINQGNIYRWNFNNILLPDSTINEPKSHGYICYRVKPKNTIAVGDTIKNAASIYFDFHLPVKTNIAKTTITENNIVICSGGTTVMSSRVDGQSYQWQVNMGNGYENVSNNVYYQGSTSKSLQLSGPPTSWYGNIYRCAINTDAGIIYSNHYILKFMTFWQGTLSNLWNTPGNWSCGLVPDENTDVIINSDQSNFPAVNANISVRSLTIKPGAAVTVKNGYNITIRK